MVFSPNDIKDILSIYNFQYFDKLEYYKYLNDQYSINGKYLCSMTRLLLLDSITDIPDTLILNHLTKRIPIYYDKAVSHLFDWKKVKQLLSYDYKDLQIDKSLGEFIGVAKLSTSFCKSFATSLSKLIDDGGKSDYFEAAIDPILNVQDVYFEDISHLPCIEIDFKEDLQKANELVKNKLFNV